MKPLVRVQLGTLQLADRVRILLPVVILPLVSVSCVAAVTSLLRVRPAALFNTTLVNVVAPVMLWAAVPLKVHVPLPEVKLPKLLKLPVMLVAPLPPV